MTDLQKLVARRNAFLAQVKGELLVAKNLNQRRPSQSEVRDRLDQLKVLAGSFRDTQSEIEQNQKDPEAVLSVLNVREEFFGDFYKTKDLFECYLEELEPADSQKSLVVTEDWREALHLLIKTQQQLVIDQATSNHAFANLAARVSNSAIPPEDCEQSDQVSSGAPRFNVRLPAINVPIFRGDRKGWMTFKDLFVSTIHDRRDLTDSLKMQYLFSYLDGDAKRMVNKYTISSVNYQHAWLALCNHYDKKRYTVFALVREFMEQPTVSVSNLQALSKLVTTSDELVQQLDALGEEYQSRDPWLIYLTLEKLDKDTRASWSQEVVENENPTFEELLQFLQQRCEVLETCSAFSKKSVSEVNKKENLNEKKIRTMHTEVSDKKCAKCSKEHNVYQCDEFKSLSVEERRNLAKQARLCYNCLRSSHSAKTCSSKSVCRTSKCNQRHHTLLCPADSNPQNITGSNESGSQKPCASEEKKETIASLTTDLPIVKQSVSLLPTAVVKVRKSDGTFASARVLIDSGSQASMVTEELVRKLALPRSNGKVSVCGIGQSSAGTTRGMVALEISSRFNEVVLIKTKAYILGKLTSTLPAQRFYNRNLSFLGKLNDLADPSFSQPSKIDIVLGTDVFLALLESGQVKDESGQTVAQKTIFGWIVAGRYDQAEIITSSHAIVNLYTEMDLNQALQKFWEQEEINKVHQLTPSEIAVTEHFRTTLQRDETGRFIVRLPFDDSKPYLGESLTAAKKRLVAMERRFVVQPEFKRLYSGFMSEYLELGHMELVPNDEVMKDSAKCYYLPHHAVMKEDSTTTKLRVVFDASCATASGVSLNDRLMAGPNNNADLFSVLLRFRTYKVAFSADVTKMYRQILVHPDDR
ncbi:uncharacterized protein LOC129742509 [Uranotaenia lowii]|uniref:uncharacterized protein LOC129742509 n=1 Tax=Uranotaenia lowii TaxID=190385 RepID=UPI00247A804B|nr:uncharacterized protein LOC129742509 [Uranotaenia lowii]